MAAWRLCLAIHAAGAFSGEGARRYGGRWNSRGVPMVYCSSSLALAAIELFVHLDPTQAPSLVAIAATLPEDEPAGSMAQDELSPDWWADPAGTRALGDAWMRDGASLALRVPSVPIRAEWNVLLNPLHPRMAELRIDPPRPFVFDTRMFERSARSRGQSRREGINPHPHPARSRA